LIFSGEVLIGVMTSADALRDPVAVKLVAVRKLLGL
jgi:hypothetical protein